MPKVLVMLADGFEDIEAVTVVDVLRRGGVEVVTASITDRVDVRSAHSMMVKADALLSELEEVDFTAIVLPGGGEGTENLGNSDRVIDRLRRQKAQGGLLCAICAAPTVLVEAGVLDDGQQITCYPTMQMELDRQWIDQPVVVHDDVITSQAPGTAMLFSLAVLQAVTDDRVAQKVARSMVTDALEVDMFE